MMIETSRAALTADRTSAGVSSAHAFRARMIAHIMTGIDTARCRVNQLRMDRMVITVEYVRRLSNLLGLTGAQPG